MNTANHTTATAADPETLSPASPSNTQAHTAKLTGYIIGFVLSLGLTLVAYQLVQMHLRHTDFSHRTVFLLVAGLAVTQLFVQLVLFLHLGEESRPRWNLIMFSCAVTVVGILVVGSLWIMYNLDYNMNQQMTVQQQEQYLKNQDGL